MCNHKSITYTLNVLFSESNVENFEVVLAVDINTVANAVYRHYFPLTNLKDLNISSITHEQFDAYHPDVLLMSPPCQPFTRQDFNLIKNKNDRFH